MHFCAREGAIDVAELLIKVVNWLVEICDGIPFDSFINGISARREYRSEMHRCRPRVINRFNFCELQPVGVTSSSTQHRLRCSPLALCGVDNMNTAFVIIDQNLTPSRHVVVSSACRIPIQHTTSAVVMPIDVARQSNRTAFVQMISVHDDEDDHFDR